MEEYRRDLNDSYIKATNLYLKTNVTMSRIADITGITDYRMMKLAIFLREEYNLPDKFNRIRLNNPNPKRAKKIPIHGSGSKKLMTRIHNEKNTEDKTKITHKKGKDGRFITIDQYARASRRRYGKESRKK
ncbi:MAG: hypothetical protein ACTSRG_21890 [Candidatus Helarchaeota archaeon]